MLFDEKELNVFDNNESRTYFKEILQSYYSQNYRATIRILRLVECSTHYIKLDISTMLYVSAKTLRITEYIR